MRLKTTTIYVTHDQEEAMTLGDRIVCMKDGKIHQADTPLQTYQNPANRFVAGFIGMPPMNFFDGTIRLVDGEMVFTEGRLVNARPAGRGAVKASDKKADDEPVVMVGELTLPDGGFTIPVPARLREVLAGMVGRHVVLGVRPEHIHLTELGSHGSPVKVRLKVTEPLGKEMDVYMATMLNDHVVGRVEAQGGLQMDSAATVYVDLRKVHFFEPGETGMNLSATVEPAHALA